jgi:hypothetical protein
VRGLRPRKRWRYVAVFCDRLMACAAQVQIGVARQSFWALLDRRDDTLRERTRLLIRRGAVALAPGLPDGAPQRRGAAEGNGAAREQAGQRGRLLIADGGVWLALELEEQPGWEALCAHGRYEVWTRKQAGVRAHGTLSLDGGPAEPIEALAVIDDTSGHHARETEWRWSAGVGEAPDGTPLAWNLVSGVNDPAHGSERAIWVDGEPREASPVSFAEDLSSIRGEDGSELRFSAEAERSRSDELLVVRSEYRAPFGTFAGTLPGGIALARGLGVMEHHRARW